jgi:hypothetical protein
MTSLRLFPKSGTTRGGTLVGIAGTDLPYQSCTATFGQMPAQMLASYDNYAFSVITPPHDAGAIDVTVVCGSQKVTMPKAFSYVATDDPPVSEKSFWWSQMQQGESAVVAGDSLHRDDVVLVNGVAVPDVTTPEVETHVYFVPNFVGPAVLTLRDHAGREVTRAVTILPAAAPAITTLPDRVPIGAEFSIVSKGLRPGLTYMIGPAPVRAVQNAGLSYAEHAKVHWSNMLPAVFRAPIIGPGMYPFTVSDNGSVILTKSIELTTSGPVVSSVTPRCAPYEGGSFVSISGSGFDDGASVRFFTTFSPEVVVKDRFTIIAKLPPFYGTSNPQITVFNPDGTTATLTKGFSYTFVGDPGCNSGRHRAAGH